MFELLEARGNTLGEPYTKSLKGGLFEIRIKSDEGIARSIYCYEMGKRIIILLTFVKKCKRHQKAY
ncbi:type II toxin-antitoxin system RelE/ParE family toxin [Campylobacter concisus]|nr:type II toxin-antitoxin system RelE/ParE family toxin [Campylobacter concisus]